MDAALERLLISVSESRAIPARHRQHQLQRLHESLVSAATTLNVAIAGDSPRHTPAEIEAEFSLATDAVRHFYDSIDVLAEHHDEYAVAHGKNNLNRRLPVGLVLIKPSRHTRLFSAVSAVAAAIAGGNCVILELLRNERRSVDGVLSHALGTGLDANTFWVSQEPITDKELLSRSLLVDQTGPPTGTHPAGPNGAHSSPRTRSIAVVDRSADIDAAARDIVRARFGFGGSSPYGPDIVLVHEFAKQSFFEACSRYATVAFAGRPQQANRALSEDEAKVIKRIKSFESQNIVVTFGANDFKLVEVVDRRFRLPTAKVTGCYLFIATFSSLADAVSSQDIENAFSLFYSNQIQGMTPEEEQKVTAGMVFHPPLGNLLAGYFYADLASAKYLSQYIPSHISCINHIPTQLLLGPAAPLAHAPDIPHRYTRDMFTLPRPQFVPPATSQDKVSHAVNELLHPADKTSKKVSLKSIRALATRPLKPTGQPKSLEGTDHFLSGLLVGGGILLAVVVPAVGWTSYVLGKGAWGYLGKWRR